MGYGHFVPPWCSEPQCSLELVLWPESPIGITGIVSGDLLPTVPKDPATDRHTRPLNQREAHIPHHR
jgi:hypothetical protein